MESNHDDSYDVQFQRQSFEEKATRFDDMLEKLHAGDEFDEKFEELMRRKTKHRGVVNEKEKW